MKDYYPEFEKRYLSNESTIQELKSRSKVVATCLGTDIYTLKECTPSNGEPLDYFILQDGIEYYKNIESAQIAIQELHTLKDIKWYGTYGQHEAACPNCLRDIDLYFGEKNCPFCKQLINWNSKKM